MPKIKAINVPSFATSPAIVLVKGHQDKDDRTYVFWTLEEAIEKAIAFFDKHDLRDRGYEYPRSIDNVAHIFAYDSSSYRVLTIDEAVKYIEADGSLPGLHDEARGQGLVSGATKYVIDVLGIVFE